jgi:predicted secreted Zn-dependent protease
MQDTNPSGERGEVCPDCSAVVADLESHERWHSRVVADLARAVEKEIKRTLTSTR